jgi:hypothetical protein
MSFSSCLILPKNTHTFANVPSSSTISRLKYEVLMKTLSSLRPVRKSFHKYISSKEDC